MNLNIFCLKKACEELSIDYEEIDNHGDFISVKVNNQVYYFHDVVTPLNSEIVSKICLDKEFTIQLLKNDINLPKTIGYLDPEVKREKVSYVKFNNIQEIIKDIENNFKLPIIIKRNTGRGGHNVFLANSVEDLGQFLTTIYSKNTKKYDYIALAQEKINIKTEFRIVVLNKKIEFVYIKDNSNAKFTGNISPLHFDGAKAILVDNEAEIEKLTKFINPIFGKIDLMYAGLDVALDINGKYWLIEMNTRPGFEYFAKDNGNEQIIRLYRNILINLDARINYKD